jgi:hypothetical protein
MLWGFWKIPPTHIEVSVPYRRRLRRDGIHVHRRRRWPLRGSTKHRGIPVTGSVQTLIDLAAIVDRELPIAKRAGLPRPLTQKWVNGFRVDFYWPGLGLVVETDGGAFHRTASQQTKDRVRDQTHFAAGLVPLRFTHDQIAHDPGYVEESLRKILRRLQS